METGFSFQWHITDICDQRCRHCYVFAENCEKTPVSMSFDQMREVITRCDAFTAGLGMRPLFAVTGGDPVLCPDFWRLTELLKERGDPFVMMGNPFHLDAEVCKRLRDCGCYQFQVSLDGMEKTHDRLRKPGSFRKTLESIPVISRSGIRASVMMTVSEQNYRELPDVMDAVAAAGADGFAFTRYAPTSTQKSSGIPPMEYRKLLDTYIKKRRAYMVDGTFTRFMLKEHLFVLYAYEEGKLTLPEYCHTEGEAMPGGCHCAAAGLSILPDGTVMACRRAENTRMGNIFTDSLREMWENTKRIYRRYDSFSRCSGCRLMPWCRGCPAVSCGETGDFFGGDPQCWHVIEDSEFKKGMAGT